MVTADSLDPYGGYQHMNDCREDQECDSEIVVSIQALRFPEEGSGSILSGDEGRGMEGKG
ncbi:hypothetical protein NQZ68_019905 [Dissostichus eleginoides]|nr:hypothetical protein NQZ68_019905 [Dissostichus eleginoides]